MNAARTELIVRCTPWKRTIEPAPPDHVLPFQLVFIHFDRIDRQRSRRALDDPVHLYTCKLAMP